jgi:hypothetical protein
MSIRLADRIGLAMIRDTGYRFENMASGEVIMGTSTVVRFSENFDRMTAPECLAFIERSRRQIDRLEHLPRQPGEVDSDELASIRKNLDALEKRVRSYPANG